MRAAAEFTGCTAARRFLRSYCTGWWGRALLPSFGLIARLFHFPGVRNPGRRIPRFLFDAVRQAIDQRREQNEDQAGADDDAGHDGEQLLGRQAFNTSRLEARNLGLGI